MAKVQNISEIHPTLGFTEFDILEKYRKSFNESELGLSLIHIYITVAPIMVPGFTKIVQQDTPPTDIRFSILLQDVYKRQS